MFAAATFRVITNPNVPEDWNAELGQLFEFGRHLIANLNADISAGRLPARSCLKGALLPGQSAAPDTLNDLGAFSDEYPLELQSPFEGTGSISGGVWHGSRLFGSHRDDAVLKLRFEAGTKDLPMHSHEHSDRAIVVLEGSGQFHVTAESICDYSGTADQRTGVRVGDVLAFSRGVIHTFETDEAALVLLSYHAPYIPLDDPCQYTVPRKKS